MGLINVVGELAFDAPISPEDLATLECSDGRCYERCRLHLVHLLLAVDRKRALLLFHAPDAESVRVAFRHMRVACEHVWACGEVP